MLITSSTATCVHPSQHHADSLQLTHPTCQLATVGQHCTPSCPGNHNQIQWPFSLPYKSAPFTLQHAALCMCWLFQSLPAQVYTRGPLKFCILNTYRTLTCQLQPAVWGARVCSKSIHAATESMWLCFGKGRILKAAAKISLLCYCLRASMQASLVVQLSGGNSLITSVEMR